MIRQRPLVIAAGIALLVIATMVGTAYVAWHAAKRTIEREILTPKEETVDIASLVTRVRSLNRLETAAMHVVHVGTITQSYKLVPDAFAGDRITFLAAGDVVAGIDLSQLRETDVWREGDGTIALRLPRPQVLVTRVDNRESRVLNRTTGMLRREDVNLETRARQHAESMIRAEALRKGVITLAEQNAETHLGQFLHTLGFQKVRFVRSGAAPAGAR